LHFLSRQLWLGRESRTFAKCQRGRTWGKQELRECRQGNMGLMEEMALPQCDGPRGAASILPVGEQVQLRACPCDAP
jgi:hypothetical protein